MKPNELSRTDRSINGLDKYFERKEKAKLMRIEKTPEKNQIRKSATKLRYADKLRVEDKENLNEGQQNKAKRNLENTIMVLHQQLHSLEI